MQGHLVPTADIEWILCLLFVAPDSILVRIHLLTLRPCLHAEYLNWAAVATIQHPR
jgi:hypothetical protein